MNRLMTGIVASIVMLSGCSHSTTLTPVELPDNIHGLYVPCDAILKCESALNGICKDGYWVAQQLPTSGVLSGEVIVCKN
jgi:hypothetical protein